MKAIAVYPGKPHSMHLEDVPMPNVADIPGGRGVLVKVRRWSERVQSGCWRRWRCGCAAWK